jgi:KDO2-lipid IV(A) lauroyltransferase
MSNNRGALKYYIIYPLQAIFVAFVYGFFRVLPISVASTIGSIIGRIIGPQLFVTKRAKQNLMTVFPEKSSTEIQTIIYAMWDNLGRTAAEYPHVSKINTTRTSGRVNVIRGDIYEAVRDAGGPCIIFSGHFANWELLPASAAQLGLSTTLVYRAANNPMVDWLFRRRSGHQGASIAPKGAQGARILLKALKEGKALGILVDQKMNDGIAIPFFGRNAMTAPAIAELALRSDCPVIPAHVVRTKGANFKIIIEEPLVIKKTGHKKTDIETIMCQINACIEVWVQEHPAQWLWLHNRWPNQEIKRKEKIK